MIVKVSLIKVRERIRDGFFRFGVFHFCVAAVAVLLVLSNHSVVSDSVALNASRGICWGALAGVFAQLVGEWRNRPLKKYWVVALTAAVGALGCWFWFSAGETSPRYWLWLMLYGGTSFSLAAASLAVLSSYAEERTLVPRLALNALGAFGSAAIFIAGQATCLAAFDSLVMSFDSTIYADVVGVSWIVIVSIGFISFLPGRDCDDGSSDRATAFLFWLLLPAALLLLAILYVYLGKIVVTGSMPSGKLNWFGSVALASYVFFWLSLRGSSNRFFRLFARWGWALLLPVLAAQVVGIVIRYQAYGLSALRYAGMAALSVGIVALVLAALDRRPRGLFVYMAVAGLVFTVSPLNIVDVPVRNQEGRLRAALARNGLLEGDGLRLKTDVRIPDEDAKIIVSAWKYLVSDGTYRGCWWSNSSSSGDVTPTVWHRPAFGMRLGDIPQLLGLGGARSVGGTSSGDHVSMSFPLAGDGFLPTEGYSHFKVIDNESLVQCYHDRGRWTLKYALPGEKDWQQYDVTECVERIFAVSGCKGVITRDMKFELTESEALWRLRPDLTLAIGGFRTSGTVGREIRYVSLGKCTVLAVRKVPAPDAVEQQ